MDDLAVGKWVMVSGYRSPPKSFDYENPFSSDAPHEPIPPWAGSPMRILAISLPYIATRMLDGTVMRFNTRALTFSVATKQYRDALTPKVAKAKPAEPDDNRCPRCRGKMVHRKSFSSGSWETVCPNCHRDGEAAAA